MALFSPRQSLPRVLPHATELNPPLRGATPPPHPSHVPQLAFLIKEVACPFLAKTALFVLRPIGDVPSPSWNFIPLAVNPIIFMFVLSPTRLPFSLILPPAQPASGETLYILPPLQFVSYKQVHSRP